VSSGGCGGSPQSRLRNSSCVQAANRKYLSAHRGLAALIDPSANPPAGLAVSGKKNLPSDSLGFDRDLISQARFVLGYAPDLAKQVMAGGLVEWPRGEQHIVNVVAGERALLV
jgi:hypothetical protein